MQLLLCHDVLRLYFDLCRSATDDLVRRMESLALFDDVVTRDLLFLSVHDAILFIRLETASENTPNPVIDKVR